MRTALLPLPALLDEEKWDAVRSVLKTPPVGLLWNLGESKNTLRQLADARDDVELFVRRRPAPGRAVARSTRACIGCRRCVGSGVVRSSAPRPVRAAVCSALAPCTSGCDS